MCIVTLYVIPTFHLFNRERQRAWCLITLCVNVVLTPTYVFFVMPRQDSFTLNSRDLKNALLITSMTIVLCISFTMYLGNLVNWVYEEVKRTNEVIERNTKEKEEFFATISHEIRNPLQSLQGSVELLAELSKTNQAQLMEDLPTLLDISKGCCGIVINLVSNILDMSKIAADKMQLSLVSTDLRELSNRIVRTSRGRAEGKNIRLEFECDPELPPAVEVDPQRVEQILVNLVSNAIKFTSAKGRIVLKLSWLSSPAETVESALARSGWKHTMDFSEESCRHATLRPDSQGGRLGLRYLQGMTPSLHSGSVSRNSSIVHCIYSEGASGRVHLVRPDRGLIKVEVMDSGIGIAKEGTEKLFKPYQQANSSISRHLSAV